jgi:uncharacterized membrane protein YhaH (DUF805 family)
MPLSQLLFSFQGRLNRKPYWLTILATVVIIILLIVFALMMFGEHDFWTGGLLLVLLVILYIPLIWISLAIGAKRLHDRDKSAWWLLLFYLAPAVLSSAGNHAGDIGIILHLASFSITVWAFVELGCLRGTVGLNRFGPDPLAPAILAAAGTR